MGLRAVTHAEGHGRWAPWRPASPVRGSRATFLTVVSTLAFAGGVTAGSASAIGVAGWSTAHVDAANPGLLMGVSCPSTTLCVAVDDKNDVLSSSDPAGGAQAWSSESLGREDEPLLGLSCPSTSLCVAGRESSLYASTDPASPTGNWTKELEYSFPAPDSGEGEQIFGPLASVSCVAESTCAAALDSYDEYDELLTSADPLGGATAWSSVGESRVVGSGNAPPPHDEDPILGVSCASTSLCVAVDLAGNVLATTDAGDDDSTWTRTPVDTNALVGISCPSVRLCVAVDRVGDVAASTDPSGGATAWQLIDTGDRSRLTGVSCASESLCVAVDAAGNVLSSTDPASRADTWSVTAVDPGHELRAVSCTPSAEGLCAAVDDDGDAAVGSFPPPTEPVHEGSDESGGIRTMAALIATGTGSSTALPTNTPKISNFAISQIKLDRGGRLALKLETPTAGALDAVATTKRGAVKFVPRDPARRKADHSRKISYGTGSAVALGPGTIEMTVAPDRRALRVLRELGNVRVSIAIVFRPRSGPPETLENVATVRAEPHRLPSPDSGRKSHG
jgi:hypothetical protein